MISQTAPRKSLKGVRIPEEKGFFVEGTDYADCIRQLKEYSSRHPEKWIYIHNCGIGPGYPIPVAKQLLEVSIYDTEPAGLLLFSSLFQEGCDDKH